MLFYIYLNPKPMSPRDVKCHFLHVENRTDGSLISRIQFYKPLDVGSENAYSFALRDCLSPNRCSLLYDGETRWTD